ncbi:VTT domain-containing protein [Luteolibacter arcticus]|uniref:TVP38/TMEM64 family membrane protein n=1 Tax=Luteolibacter arcticus TaxID=1581411 RepID=A0ABT3GKX3_9BACT|nr:VTT domain-containing protein [Luteolibacter arcticus]MCW1924152.1 VTT domain-containing protein [Luteolibacter arcticus]
MDQLLVWKDRLLEVLNTAPPALFLAGMVLLPLGPFPVSVLFVLAGARFGAVAGFGLGMLALAVNMTLGYWLARRVVRTPLERWLTGRGIAVPRLGSEDELRFLLLFRIAPGMPLFLQNYILGLAEVGFGRYLAVSLLAQLPYAVGFVWIGQALTESSAWKVVLTVAGVVALALLVSLLRSWLSRRQPVREE